MCDARGAVRVVFFTRRGSWYSCTVDRMARLRGAL